MIKGKALIALGLVAALPSFMKNADRIETAIRAEKTRIEYLVEWPFKKTYEFVYSEVDDWHAIIKSTLLEFGLEKSLNKVAKETEIIDEKKSIQMYIAGENKDPVSKYMAKFYLLDNAKKIGLKTEVAKTRKEIAEEYKDIINILEDSIKMAEETKNSYYIQGLNSSKDRINEIIKEKKIILKKPYKPSNSQ